ncbi:isopentenyl-diphosphate Delta-isomerase [Georgenia faecalis]|uniref:isopentenyl-diphosphate Delta-isomerase n=1 Tax=Georgenia faecalis TaxID=2483799 RepID=UPI000FD74FEB|nr:isopentenyl-diphosphate Delta-isomerase [Georgenia faecalis]
MNALPLGSAPTGVTTPAVPTSEYGTVERVILLAEDGTPVGVADKAEVHTRSTPLHLAFSCHIRDARGQVLVTRRALSKKTWPGVWTNSLCGHPAPGESFESAIARRAHEELGLELTDIRMVLPDFRYRAVDASGVVENEICPVFTARAGSELAPNPAEVMDYTWVAPSDLRRAIEVAPWALSPWLVEHSPGLALLVDESDRSEGPA